MAIGKVKGAAVDMKAWLFSVGFAVLLAIGILVENFILLEICFLGFSLYVGLKGGYRALMYFTVFTFLQNIFLIVFSDYLSNVGNPLIIVSKELIVYCSLVILYVRKDSVAKLRLTYWEPKVLLLFLLLILYSFFTSPAPVSTRIISLRQISIPFVCLLFGNSLNMMRGDINGFLKKYDALIAVFCLVGLCIYLMPMSFWDSLNYACYYKQKNGVEFDGMYTNFISHDFGISLKRFVSVTADPIASAHLIGISLLGVFIMRRKLSMYSLLILLCSVLTFSKSLIFLIFVTVFVYIYFMLKKASLRFFFMLFSSVGLVFVYGFAESYVANLSANTATGNHLNSFFYALNNLSLFGNGLGTAGFNVIASGGIVDAAEATESFFAIMIMQTGVVGTLLFYSYLFLNVQKLILLYRKNQSVLVLFSVILLLDVSLESVASGSSIAMLGTSLYFIIPGIVQRCYGSKTRTVV